MFRRIALPLALLAGCGLASAQQPPASQVPRSHVSKAKRAKRAPAPVPVPTPVATPPVPVYTPPPTPETMPAQPPQVNYANGMLTIVAANSTLGDILNAVKSRTGATIDAPGALSERVATQLGPAPPRQVLADLLKGSHYDYVMVGSENDPQGIRSIILTRNSSPAGAASASSAPPPIVGRGVNEMMRAMRGRPPGAQPAEEQPVPEAEVEQPEEAPTAPEQVAPPHAQGQVGAPGQQVFQPQQPPDINQPGQTPQAGQPGQPGQAEQRVRTPEELLQELQRMQQQQQQQQQEQEQER